MVQLDSDQSQVPRAAPREAAPQGVAPWERSQILFYTDICSIMMYWFYDDLKLDAAEAAAEKSLRSAAIMCPVLALLSLLAGYFYDRMWSGGNITGQGGSTGQVLRSHCCTTVHHEPARSRGHWRGTRDTPSVSSRCLQASLYLC